MSLSICVRNVWLTSVCLKRASRHQLSHRQRKYCSHCTLAPSYSSLTKHSRFPTVDIPISAAVVLTALFSSPISPSLSLTPYCRECQGDFDGDLETNLATDVDISVTCDSCANSAVEEDTSTASKLIVGVFPASGAGIVAAASAWACW